MTDCLLGIGSVIKAGSAYDLSSGSFLLVATSSAGSVRLIYNDSSSFGTGLLSGSFSSLTG